MGAALIGSDGRKSKVWPLPPWPPPCHRSHSWHLQPPFPPFQVPAAHHRTGLTPTTHPPSSLAALRLSPQLGFFSMTKKTGLPAFLDRTFPEISTLSPSLPHHHPSPSTLALSRLPPFFLLSASAVLLPCRHRLPSASPTCRSLIHLVPINQPNRSGCLRPGRTSIQPTISAVPGSCSGCGIVQQEQLRIRINPVEEKETR